MSVIRVRYKNENHKCFCDDAVYPVIKDVDVLYESCANGMAVIDP